MVFNSFFKNKKEMSYSRFFFLLEEVNKCLYYSNEKVALVLDSLEISYNEKIT